MTSDTNTEVERIQALLRVAADFLPHVLLHLDKVAEPLLQVGGGVDAREVRIVGSVSEPAAHLHQRVVRIRATHVVADQQTLKREPARETVASDDDDLERRVAAVVEDVFRGGVELQCFDRVLQERADVMRIVSKSTSAATSSLRVTGRKSVSQRSRRRASSPCCQLYRHSSRSSVMYTETTSWSRSCTRV